MKNISILILCLSVLINFQGCSNQLAANRYLKMKVKPSDQLRIENQEVIEKGNKAYKKQLEINKKDIMENNKEALKMKKRYHLHHSKKKRILKLVNTGTTSTILKRPSEIAGTF